MTPAPSRMKALPLPGCEGAEALIATEPDARFALHAHAEWSVGAILEGACEFACEGVGHRAVAGDLVVMAPHALHTAGASARHFRMVMVYLPPAWVAGAMGRPGGERPLWRCAVWHDAGRAAALGRGVSDDARRLPGLLQQILADAAGRAPVRGARPGDPRDPRVESLCALLQAEEAVPDLTELARRLGLSREHAHRLFRTAVGLTPGHYARLARIARAKALLREGAGAADVAAACGFADQAHFARWFRRCFGVTPSRYRASA